MSAASDPNTTENVATAVHVVEKVEFDQRLNLVRTTLKMAWQTQAFLHMELEVLTAHVARANMPNSHTNEKYAKDFTLFMSDLDKEDIKAQITSAKQPRRRDRGRDSVGADNTSPAQ